MLTHVPIARKFAILTLALGALLVALMLHAFLRFREHEGIYRQLLNREKSQLYLPRANTVLHDLARLLHLRVHAAEAAEAQRLDAELAQIRDRMRAELAEARRRLPARAAELDALAVRFDQVLRVAVETRQLKVLGQEPQAVHRLCHDFDPALQGMRDALREVADHVRKDMAGDINQSGEAIRRVAGRTLLASLAVLAGGLTLGLVFVWRNLSRPLQRSAHVMAQLARRDPHAVIEGSERGDEVGEIARGLVAFRESLLQQQKLEAERKRTLERLQTSEQQFRRLVEAAPDALLISDSQNRIALVNARAEALFGWSRDEVVGQPCTALFPERLREQQSRDMDQLADAPAGRSGTHELWLRRQDGSEFPAEVSVSPIADPAEPTCEGCINALAIAVRDITTRERVQRDLADQLAFREALLDTIPYPIFIKDADARFIGCNRAYEQAFNTTRQWMRGRTVLDLEYLPLTERHRFHAEDVEVIAKADRRSYELPITFASDGQEHVTLYSVDGFRLADGRPGGLIGLLVDITDRQQAEAELRHSQQLLQSIMDNSRAIIYLKDPKGRYLMVNRQWEEFLGMPTHAVLGRRDSDLFPPETAGRFLEVDDQVRTSLTAVTAEEELIQAGRRHVFLSQKFPLLDRKGRLFALGGVSTDITPIKETQEALAAARDAADDANRAKSAFLATMSHEIRTPMNAVLNMTALALDTNLSPKQRQYLGVTYSSARSLLALINDILDFSKIEAGRLDLETAPFRLRAVLEEVTDSFRARVLEKHLEFVVHVEPDVPDHLLGDSLRLRQVLNNLIGNAFKFTDQGEVVVTVALAESSPPPSAREPGSARLRVAVRDTGIGIPADKQAQIFAVFSQADSSIARKYGGTGLGLAISQRLVGLMGGQLAVKSEPGQGSTFTFTAQLGYTPAPRRPSPPLPTGLKSQHVLVVEDNSTSRELLAALFASFNLPCAVTDSAEAGWALLERRNLTRAAAPPFDLLVLDWLLPGADGLELLRRIRKHPRLQSLPVIMISCFAGQEEETLARELGVSAFVPKPLTASMLLDAVMDAQGLTHEKLHAATSARLAEGEFHGRRVLLAEDNEANQFVAQELLQRAGIELDIAEDGRRAVELVRTREYDAVLMDIQMPEMDGLAATQAIRAERAGRPLPIIALTANARQADLEICLAAGMDDYVAKPIDRVHLFEVLRRWLPRPNPPEPETASPAADSASAPPAVAADTRATVDQPPPATPDTSSPPPQDEPSAPPSPPAAEAATDTANGEPSPAESAALPDATPAEPSIVASDEAVVQASSLHLPQFMVPEQVQADQAASPTSSPRPAAARRPRTPKPRPPAPAEPPPQQQQLFGAPPPPASSADGAAPRPATADWPDLPGVDLADAARRLGLPLESILGMLARFPTSARRTLTDLREALEAADADTARRHAHSLAGAAGNLSVETFRRLAKTLELALKAQTGNYETLFGELTQEADRVFATLDTLPAPARPTPPPPSMTTGVPAPMSAGTEPGPLRLLLEELAAQLDTGDVDASAGFLAELERSPAPETFRRELATLRALTEEFNFTAAAALARRLAAGLA